MDKKDWAIVVLLLLAFSGPLGVHLWHQSKQKRSWDAGNIAGANPGGTGPISDTVPGFPAIDDGRRMGAAIGAVGGRAMAEGAKAGHRGAKAYGNRAHRHDHMLTGGAV